MSYILGVDYSTFDIDVVLIDEADAEPPRWHRYELRGHDAFERARDVRRSLVEGWCRDGAWPHHALAIGIEDPAGHHAVRALARVQGAILARLPRDVLVVPLAPAQWRKTVGLPGNATKQQVADWALTDAHSLGADWTLRDNGQDCLDAYCIAVATRLLIQHPDLEEAA